MKCQSSAENKDRVIGRKSRTALRSLLLVQNGDHRSDDRSKICDRLLSSPVSVRLPDVISPSEFSSDANLFISVATTLSNKYQA